jgi:hypothetical protein
MLVPPSVSVSLFTRPFGTSHRDALAGITNEERYHRVYLVGRAVLPSHGPSVLPVLSSAVLCGMRLPRYLDPFFLSSPSRFVKDRYCLHLKDNSADKSPR